LGFQVTALPPPDIYDGLNRGLIDSTQMGLAPMIAMAWYEEAPYWALDGSYSAGNMYTANLDWWNGLSAAQQKVIQDAADSTETFSTGLYDDVIASDVAKIEEATGNKFAQLSQADIDKLWAACFDSSVASAIDNAEKNNKGDGMRTILKKAAEITGYSWNG
jgi:TRAP-type C4-dicarboxylate transport system substrate-binding protein